MAKNGASAPVLRQLNDFVGRFRQALPLGNPDTGAADLLRFLKQHQVGAGCEEDLDSAPPPPGPP